jgi:hypothetical protein
MTLDAARKGAPNTLEYGRVKATGDYALRRCERDARAPNARAAAPQLLQYLRAESQYYFITSDREESMPARQLKGSGVARKRSFFMIT